jgi:glycosyltransferase involved in cell wall biosynthesis
LGGIELQVHDLAGRQVAAGHDVTVITSTVDSDPVGVVGDGHVVRVGGSGRDNGAIRYRRSGRGRDAVRGGGFDVVHVHASSFSPLAFLAARESAQRGIPTVVTLHSLWATASPLFLAADWVAGWGDWPVAWSAVSNAAASSLRRVVSGRAEVTILPNGIDPGFWETAPVAGNRDELRLVVVARLAARKRPLSVARILREARRRLPASKLISVDIVGEGPERGRLERYLSRAGMSAWVRLPGRLSRTKIRSTFRRSDLFVSAALLESFGIAALEARCAGLPILARSGTGVEDFVVHRRDGWLVDSDAAMVDTIVSVANDPDALDNMRAHYRSVPTRVTWPGVLASCEALYRAAALRQDMPGLDAVHLEATEEAIWPP